MIPAWKLRRELYRGYEYLWALAGLAYEPLLKRRHDRWRARQPVPTDQGIALRDKVAVVLIFQPRAIPASLVVTLRHLGEQGYAPLVVSNAPMSPEAQAALAPVVWRMIERPNFGYDFGGYRDGILLLRQWGVAPQRLIVMNDSIWMPLTPGSTLITRMETAQGDIIGGYKHPDSIRKRSGTVRAGFLESYLYLVNATAWSSPAFIRFWQRYRVSSNKLNAVYRGERGFSRTMAASGLSIVGLFSPEGLLAVLNGQTVEVLQRTLSYGAYTEADLADESLALLRDASDSPGWRERVMQHVGKTIGRRRFNASFPFPSVLLLEMELLKKSAGPPGAGTASLHTLMRRKYLLAVRAGDLPSPFPDVLAELEARDRSGPSDPA